MKSNFQGSLHSADLLKAIPSAFSELEGIVRSHFSPRLSVSLLHTNPGCLQTHWGFPQFWSNNEIAVIIVRLLREPQSP